MVQDLKPGMPLIPLKKTPVQRQINLYAQMSGDFNPIHIDPAFAKQSQFNRTIAHGMLIIGYLSEMMLINFGQPWLENGWLTIRFRAPALSGESINIDGKIEDIQLSNRNMAITCNVLCKGKSSNPIIKGKTGLTIRN